MATSSITHNFVISPEGTQRFIDAMDRAEELLILGVVEVGRGKIRDGGAVALVFHGNCVETLGRFGIFEGLCHDVCRPCP